MAKTPSMSAIQSRQRTAAPLDPLLTILIPSYNRGRRIKILVDYLLPAIEEMRGKIDIIVSNNCSTDNTKELLALCSSEYLFVHHRTEFLKTAEENIAASLPLCRGKYVWFHGDDDIPNLGTLKYAIDLLETGQHDFLSFASHFLDGNGGMTGAWMVHMSGEYVQTDFVTGACALGLITTFAGISNSIQRRDLISARSYYEVSKHAVVYSHVAWWLAAFKDATITIVNRPLVMYRVNDDADMVAHYHSAAELMNVGTYYFWTTGIYRLFDYLAKEGVLNNEQVATLFEFRRDGSAFRFIDNIIHFVREQVILCVTDPSPRNRMTGEDLEKVLDWILRVDAGYYECVLVIKDMFQLRPDPEIDPLPSGHETSRYVKEIINQGNGNDLFTHLRGSFHILLEHKMNNNNRYVGLRSRYRDYLIYNHLSKLVAFDMNTPIDIQVALRAIDFDPKDDTIIVGQSLEELHRLIDEAKMRSFERRASPVLLIGQSLNGIREELAASRAALNGITSLQSRLIDAESSLLAMKSEMTAKCDRMAQSRAEVERQLSMADRRIGLNRRIDKDGERGDLRSMTRWLISDHFFAQVNDLFKLTLAKDGHDALIDFFMANLHRDIVPTPLIDLDWYAMCNPDLAKKADMTRLLQVLTVAIPDGLSFSPVFDEAWYRATYEEASQALLRDEAGSAFEYYMKRGAALGHDPGPDFDEAFYLETYPDASWARRSGLYISGAEHYMARGAALGYNPNSAFDEKGYHQANPDVAAAVEAGHMPSGFVHWLYYGRREGRALRFEGQTAK